MKKIMLALTLFLSGLSCRDTVSVTAGTTYFSTNNILRIPVVALSAGQKGVFQCEGIYLPFFELTKSPALVFLSAENKISYVPLSNALDNAPGDYVTIEGDVVEKPGSPRSGADYSIAVLSVGRVQKKWKTHELINRAQADFVEGKEEIQTAIALPESKLRLPDSPEWLLVADVPRSRVIAFFAAADLMYAAEVNLVYDLVSNRLTDVYAHQWFKGE